MTNRISKTSSDCAPKLVVNWSAYPEHEWEARLNASIEANRVGFQRWLDDRCQEELLLPSFMRGWSPVDILYYYQCSGVLFIGGPRSLRYPTY